MLSSSGGVACGNLGKYLPALLSSIEGSQGNSKQQYLLLQALNEVVTTVASRKAKDKAAGFTDGMILVLCPLSFHLISVYLWLYVPAG